MPVRLDHFEIAPEALEALRQVYASATRTGFDADLLQLVSLRVSQINNCTSCAHVHFRELQRRGAGLVKLLHVPLWRDAGELFDARERATLAWAEAVTDIADTRVPDADYESARLVFGEKELTDLTIAIGVINVYNRLAIAFRATPALVGVH
jgi:AhpD family alkylhydroperoxidase